LNEITSVFTEIQGDRVIREIRNPLIISRSSITGIPTPRITIKSIKVDSFGISSTIKIFREWETVFSNICSRVTHWNSAGGLFRDICFHISCCRFNPCGCLYTIRTFEPCEGAGGEYACGFDVVYDFVAREESEGVGEDFEGVDGGEDVLEIDCIV
jgi:hypothetical protein